MGVLRGLACVLWIAALASVEGSSPEEAGGVTATIVNTWPFTIATAEAWRVLQGDNAQDILTAVEKGVSACENAQCDGTVGYGGSPDEQGKTTLDAMIMNGDTMEAGSVVDLGSVKQAISTARLVMERTNHTILAGTQAAQFAVEMGMKPSDLVTNHSLELYREWRFDQKCQPNYRRNVSPDPRTSCGPYKPIDSGKRGNMCGQMPTDPQPGLYGRYNHDTIAMVGLNSRGQMAAGTSTNGATHKIPGRLADSAIPGSGAYVDSEIGGCGATGDGDVMLRFVPCYQVVESMRLGADPKSAAEDAITRIRRHHPLFQGAVIALAKSGEHAGATNCMSFSYSVVSDDSPTVHVIPVEETFPCQSNSEPANHS
mmetsp:Transcript_3634/g.9126  ORF Transcript_3634/g.9126 Transcript_3634/m.9126 type:complete len:370 (-) Transcript_3634:68-1177(-)